MKKSKKIISFFIGIIIIALIGIGINSISKKQVKTLEIKELPEDYKSWLELSDEDKAKTVKPLSFEINAEDKIISKAIKSEIKSTEVASTEDIGKYDLRDYKGVKPVKNQRSWGLCWAFSGTSSLESHLLNKSRNSIYEECKQTDFDLNPMHVGYALTNEFKYDIYNLYGSKTIDYGGNSLDNVLYWTSGMGPVSTNNFEITSESNPEYLPANEVLVQTEDVQVEGSIQFPSLNMQDASKDEKENFIKLIKQTLLQNGAVAFGGMAPRKAFEGCGYNEANYSVYTESQDEVYSAPHQMLIVGWDDTYSKENFTNGYKTGKKPSIDGAWIVQNSWGTGEGIGINGEGYYYYSYEDYGLNAHDLSSVSQTSTKDFDNIYQYNATGDLGQAKGKYAVNVFEKGDESTELLSKISFYNFYPDVTYNIYVNPDNDDIDFKKMQKVATYKDDNSFAEYVTIELDNPINLNGKKFAVGFKIETKDDKYNIPIQLLNSSNKRNDIELNHSFVSMDGKDWVDTAENEVSVFIKAFTQNSKDDTDVKIQSDIDKKEIFLKGKEEGILVTSKTKNIDVQKGIEYKIYNEENEEVTGKFNITESHNNLLYYANIVIPADYGMVGEYKLHLIYNNETIEELEFKISKMLISKINILKQEIYLEKGKTSKLQPKILIEPAEIANPEYGDYTSENGEVATVSESGIITATGIGNTIIKVSAKDGSNVSNSVVVNVVDIASKMQGNGSEENPYIIKDCEDLNLIKADLTAHYKLNNDIDLTQATSEGGKFYNNGLGWEPIGFLQRKSDSGQNIPSSIWLSFNNSDCFKGVLDGNNYSIIGLNINRPDEDYVGLFSAIQNGQVKNLNISDSNVIGSRYVASLSAFAIKSKFENIINKSNVKGWDRVAGIVSLLYDNSSINKAFNSGDLSITKYDLVNNSYYPGYVGGISSGVDNSTVICSGNTGNITAYKLENRTAVVAGIVAYMWDGKIINVYNKGNINANFITGGIIGEIRRKL